MKIKLHGDSVKLFDKVRYVPKFEKNLIFLYKLDSLDYGCSIHDGVIRVNQCALVIMKGEKISIKNLYKLKESTLIGKMQVETRDNINNQECKEVPKRKFTFTEVLKTNSIWLRGGVC